jgi:subtilase family serine protease
MWSTDNIAVNPSGGYYTGDDSYLTESPYKNGFGTPLDDNGNNGQYYPDDEAMMETSWIDLFNLTAPRLEFRHMYDIPSNGDGAMVFIMTDGDQEWELVEPDVSYPEDTGWSGTVMAWVQVSFRLEAYVGERIRVGFYFRSSPDGIEGDGWKINDVEVGGRSSSQMADLRLGNTKVLLDGYPVQAAVAGDVLEFNMTIINEGRAHAEVIVVTAYTAHPLTGGIEIGREVLLEGLSVGQSTSVTMRWVAVAGTYDLLMIIDETNVIPEENELNNERTVHLDVDDTSSGDMVVTEMHFVADGDIISGAGVGDLISIVATLANVGTSMVSTPMVVHAYDNEHGPGAEPIGDIQPKFNGLEPGGKRDINIPWRPLEGIHTVFLVVTPQDPGQLLDFNDANNITWAVLEVTDEPPVDLMVEDLNFLLKGSVTTLASEGDGVHIQATIGNDGTEALEGAMDVGIYRGDPDADGVEIGRKLVIASIAPGENIVVEFDWRVDLGTHAITIFVDPLNLVYESNEYNNQLGKGLTVTRKPLPDLTVSSMVLLLNGVELDPDVGTNEGAIVEVNITVWNGGNDKTKGSTTTELFLGNPLMEEGTSVGSIDVPEGLNPDEVFVSSIYWTAEKPKQKGDIPVLFVQVDSNDVELEADEFNNLDLRALKVGAKLPDLTVISLEITDTDGVPVTSMTYGSSIKVTATSTNIGTDVSFQVAQLSIYLDTDDPSNRIGSISTSTMGINEVVRRTLTWTPDPGKVQGGDHILIAVIDPSNEIEEASDANNNISTSIHVDSDAMPNLLLQDMWVTKGKKVVGNLDKGEKATIHLRILNLGEAPLYTTTAVELFHGDPTQGGSTVTSWPLMELEINGNVTFEADWTFEEDVPLMVFIDRNHVVEETNEQDNVGTVHIRVNPEPEGTNWLVIGVVIAVGVLVFLVMTVLLRKRPFEGAQDEEDEEDGEDEEPDQDEIVEEAAPEPEGAEEEEVRAEPEAQVEAEAPAEPEVTAEPVVLEEPAEPGEPEAAPAATCPHCGEEVDAEWILCPFCDNDLK